MPAEHELIPLRVTAVMAEPVSFGFGSVALDALLAGQVARHDGRAPPVRGESLGEPPVPPVAKDPRGFYLASWCITGELLFSWFTHVHRPAPVQRYAQFCTDKVKRIDCGGGPDKSFRLPRHRQRFRELHWFCIGDPERIEFLLRGVTRIGSHRRDGIGKRKSWTVAPCDTWDGFPVLRDGKPLRSLPIDYPGLASGARIGLASLTFPYWDPERQEQLAIP